MEYSVGSLADLISGQNTPNKPKLISKTFTTISKQSPNNGTTQTNKRAQKVQLSTENTDNQVKLRKPRNKPKKKKLNQNHTISEERKRKMPASIETPEDSLPAKQLCLGKNELNAANRIKNKFNQEMKTSTDYNEKTLFVGNIPLQVPKEEIKKHFRKYGLIQSVRIRGIPVADLKTPKKIAAIKKEYHPDRTSVYAFIKFKEGEDAKSAQAENGQLFFNHHLRVHFCEEERDYDESKAIFVGNLPFQAEEEELWNVFKSCGPISHIRIVRDGRTGMGKGFAYVNFKDADSVQLALEMGKCMMKDRELRVSFCEANRAKKKKLVSGCRVVVSLINSVKFKGKKPGKATMKKEDPKVAFTGSKFTDKKKVSCFQFSISFCLMFYIYRRRNPVKLQPKRRYWQSS